ncbi:MAG: protein kinase [Planctomycetes bacterium]|nr:protein kinase [Planctomycetota bacterium]
MTRTTAAPGLRTLGKYHVIRMLSEGPMGVVYKAKDPGTNQHVAIKLGSVAVMRDKVLLKRFEQEFRSTSSLSHPNIVRALEFGWEGTRPYIVFEYVDGEDMGRRIERLGRLTESEAVEFIIQIAEGLHEAHKNGIIHRDLKPDNILLTMDGQAKLADLGLSKDPESNMELTCDDRGLGTPNFIAPEQFGDAKHSGVRCDIYSLGATLYMAVTGETPFDGADLAVILDLKIADKLTPPRRLVSALSEHVDWAIRRAVLADPDRRFGSCPEFIAALKGEAKRSGAHAVRKSKVAGRKPAARPVRPAKERRRAVRYECALPTCCTVNLSVHPDAVEPSNLWDAQVCDLSVTGIGLVLSRRFEPGSILSVVLSNKTREFERTREVRVLRVSPAEGSGWFIGGELVEKLSRDEVRQLL